MKLPINYDECHWTVRREARNEYIRLQENKCYYCGNDLNGNPPDEILNKKVNKKLFPDNFFKWPIHLHHDHETGMTIGAVHSYCNAVSWQYDGE